MWLEYIFMHKAKNLISNQFYTRQTEINVL